MKILVINEPTINKQKLIDTINKHELSNGITFVEMEPDDALSAKIIETFQQMNDLSDKTIIINVNDSTVNQLAMAAPSMDKNQVLTYLHDAETKHQHILHDTHKRKHIKSAIHVPVRRSSDPIVPKTRRKK